MAARLTTIARFKDSFRAHLAKTYLEDRGVDAYIQGEFLGNAFPRMAQPFGQMAGGIRLQVREEDEDEARELLLEAETAAPEDFDYEPDPEECLEAESEFGAEDAAEFEHAEMQCPECESDRVQHRYFSMGDYLLFALLGAAGYAIAPGAVLIVPLLALMKLAFKGGTWRCERCSTTWEDSR